MKGLKIHLTLVILLFAFCCMISQGMASGDRDIYIIGVVEPLNKTELPGHIEFPYYGEVMHQVLSSAPNNYIVKILDERDLANAGYRFSSVRPDSDLQSDQIKALCEEHRLDAILTGKIHVVDYDLIPRFMHEAGRATSFKIEGILYDRDGSQVWSKEVGTDYEFTRDKGKFKPPFKTQLVELYSSKTRELAADLINRIGTKTDDKEAPTIEFENIRSGDKIKTTCIILKGKVSDNSKVDTISVNGQDFQLKRPMKSVEMFYPVQIPDGKPGQRVIVTIEAKDIYGYKYAKELNLTWDKSIKGLVSSINPDTISIKFDGGDFDRITTGMGFMIYSIDEFRDPLSSHRMRMFTAEKTGPVVVVQKFPDKKVVQAKFLKGHEALLNQVKTNDIAK